MKKFNWLIIFLLLLAFPASAGNFGIIAGGGASSSDSCTGVETIGWTTQEASEGVFAVGNSRVTGVFTAPCTGKLSVAYVYHSSSDSDNCQLAVYLDSGDGVPNDTEDTRVGQSATIAITAAGWATATFAAGTPGSVTKGQKYWIVLYAGNLGWRNAYKTDATYYTDADGTCDGFTNAYTEITGATACTYPTPDSVLMSAYVTLASP